MGSGKEDLQLQVGLPSISPLIGSLSPASTTTTMAAPHNQALAYDSRGTTIEESVDLVNTTPFGGLVKGNTGQIQKQIVRVQGTFALNYGRPLRSMLLF